MHGDLRWNGCFHLLVICGSCLQFMDRRFACNLAAMMTADWLFYFEPCLGNDNAAK
ncbi:hypothetical protein Peur_026053 [Populus x canadensis]